MQRASLALVAVTALLVVACGGPQQNITKETSKPTRPEWLTTTPKEPGYAFVVGVKSRAKTLEEGKAGAQQGATVQISQLVGTQIKSQAESVSSTDAAEYAKEQTEAMTAAYVKNLVQVDEYYEKVTKMVGSYFEEAYDVWVLSKFPLAAADEERKRQASEQVELCRDALKRFEDSKKEVTANNKREAWVLMGKARTQLKALPPLTEIKSGGFDTAQDLLREVEKQLRGLDELARGVRVTMAPGDAGAKSVTKAFTAKVGEAMGKTTLILRDAGDARFALDLSYTTKMGDKVMGQTVGYVTYAGNVKDNWSGASLPATSGEVKGFAKSNDGALAAAAAEAAQKIAEALATKLTEVMAAETAGK